MGSFNFEQAQVSKLGYADGLGYAIKIENRDNNNTTKWMNANVSQVTRIGGILAEGSEDANTPARDVHLRHAQMFADMLYALNARDNGTNKAVDVYASERYDKDGHPTTAYAHVRAAMRWAIEQLIPEYVDDVMETLLGSGESIEYCVTYVENMHRHRLSLAEAATKRGCWLEGSRGWRATGELVNVAATRGMPLTDDNRTVVDAYLTGDSVDVTLSDGTVKTPADIGEYVDDLSRDAHEWLDAHVAPEGWSFDWVNGEFLFLPEDAWESLEAHQS